MGLFDVFKFKRTPVSEAVGSNGAQVGLYEEEATSQLVRLLTKMPDLDEVLKQAGIKRDRLRVLLYDDEIAQATETRLDSLLATPVRLEPSEGKDAELLMEILEPVKRDILSAAFQARLFGYSVAEAVYVQRDDGKVGLRYLGEKPFEWFEPRPDGKLMYFPDDGSGGSTGVEVDQKFKFFLTRCRPTYRNPYGEALLSRLYWPWFFRQNGWKFWAKFLERFGSPLLVGKSTDPKEMVKALLLAHSQAVIGIDREDEVAALGAGQGNTGQAFDGFEAALLRRIQKVVLGQTLTSGTDNGSGNRALGQVHDTVRTDKRNSDIQLVLPTVQAVVNALCELNGFGKFEVVFGDEVGLESDRAVRDKDLYAVGVRFEKGYFQDQYDLREEDFTLSSEAPAVGSPPPNAPEGGAANPGQQQASGSGTDKKDAGAAPTQDTGAKATQGPPRLFSNATKSEGKFTAQQEVIEGQADAALGGAGMPIGRDKLRSAVLGATDPDDLADRLFAVLGDTVSAEEFRKVLEQSLFAADVIGYVHGEGKV
jgi:hypothetical protein